MLQIPSTARILFFAAPTDMRKSHCGLSGLIRNELGGDPTDGTLFLFVNRRGDRLKALYWDRDGLALWYKRLEQGTFEMLTAPPDAKSLQLEATDLAMLLGGVSMQSVKRRKRFKKAA